MKERKFAHGIDLDSMETAMESNGYCPYGLRLLVQRYRFLGLIVKTVSSLIALKK